MGVFTRIKQLFTSEPAHERFLRSSVQHPALVSNSAVIENSQLTGEIKVGDHSRIFDAALVGKITIGNNTSISGPNTDIYSLHNEVTIGNFCSIARSVSIQEYYHDHSRCTSYFIMKRVFDENMVKDTISNGSIGIGHDVWIGAQCVILSGVKIGTGAVIGANSVVNSDIPPYAIAAGSPAKVIKYRFSEEIIGKLLQLEWWSWPHDRIKRNRSLFEGTLTMDKLDRVND